MNMFSSSLFLTFGFWCISVELMRDMKAYRENMKKKSLREGLEKEI